VGVREEMEFYDGRKYKIKYMGGGIKKYHFALLYV
jgi:hypothetical protein